jgi:Leucine-rich repeat (LRR) protein
VVIGSRLHDMVLDLLRARSRQENFITISRNTSISEGTSSPSSRVRRLVHQNKTEEERLLGMDLRHVRTFVACNCNTITANKEVLSFPLLRVLHLEGCNDVNLEHVDKLLHLRYLGMARTRIIGESPEGIGDLKFLKTLDIESGLKHKKIHLAWVF